MRGTTAPLLLLTLLAIIHTCDGLPCPRCNKSLCSTHTCHYGLEPGICRCCPRCLKGPQEDCGGLWNIAGTCADGLVCNYADPLGSINHDAGVCNP